MSSSIEFVIWARLQNDKMIKFNSIHFSLKLWNYLKRRVSRTTRTTRTRHVIQNMYITSILWHKHVRHKACVWQAGDRKKSVAKHISVSPSRLLSRYKQSTVLYFVFCVTFQCLIKETFLYQTLHSLSKTREVQHLTRCSLRMNEKRRIWKTLFSSANLTLQRICRDFSFFLFVTSIMKCLLAGKLSQNKRSPKTKLKMASKWWFAILLWNETSLDGKKM